MYKKSHVNCVTIFHVLFTYLSQPKCSFVYSIEQEVKFGSNALCVLILRKGIDGCLHVIYESRFPSRRNKNSPSLSPLHVVLESSRIWCRKVYTLTSCSCVIPLLDNGRCLWGDKSLSTRNLVTSLAHSHIESGTTHTKRLFCRHYLCQIEKCGRQNVSTSEFLFVAWFCIMHSRFLPNNDQKVLERVLTCMCWYIC